MCVLVLVFVFVFVGICAFCVCVCDCGLADARKIPTRRASYCFATSVSIVIVSLGEKTGRREEKSGKRGKCSGCTAAAF